MLPRRTDNLAQLTHLSLLNYSIPHKSQARAIGSNLGGIKTLNQIFKDK